MFTFLLFISVCFAQTDPEQSGYVENVDDETKFIGWSYSETNGEVTADSNGVYTFGKDHMYEYSPDDQTSVGDKWPLFELVPEDGHKIVIQNNNDAQQNDKIQLKFKNPEDTTGQITIEIPAKTTQGNIILIKGDGVSTTTLEKPVTLKFTETEGVTPSNLYDGDATDVSISPYPFNLEYTIKDGQTDFSKYQQLQCYNNPIEIDSIKFSKNAVRFDNVKTNILTAKEFEETEGFQVDDSTECTLKKKAEDNYLYITCKLSCNEDKHLKEKSDGSGCECDKYFVDTNGECKLTCPTAEHLKEKADKSGCECADGYELKKDKCEKKDDGSGAFSTFILSVLAILFFLF